MDTKRLLLSAAAVLSLIACGTADGPKASSDNSEATVARAQVLAASTCREDGATLNVPSEKYPTIASALAAAKSGDLVRVAAGTYQECPVLVDGVTIMGPVVPTGQPPAATLDGVACNPCVVCGDATIVHGATLKGFRIIQSPGIGIRLNGSMGVHISDMAIESAKAAGVRSEKSSFVLEHSTILGCGGRASVFITQGSRAVLIANDIQGLSGGVLVHNGPFLNDPLWAPSKAWLFENAIHGNGVNGLLVQDKGSEVYGFGNRYDANLWDSVMVAGGATYWGSHETMTHAAGTGVTARGCDLKCLNSTNCSDPVLVQEATLVTLDSADIRENQGAGAYAACGATVRIRESTLAENGQEGAKAESPVWLDANHPGSAPALVELQKCRVTGNSYVGAVVLSTPYAEDQWSEAGISARDTVFAGHQQGAGIWLLGKGAVGHGTDNRYEGNFTGLHVSGGASYFGHGDTIQDSTGLGLFVLGQENMCNSPGCSTAGIVQGQAQVTMDGATIKRNGGGMTALCGATALLRNSAITDNFSSGAALTSTCDWSDLGVFSAPVVLDARGTVFANNPQWGVIAYGDSHLLLGTLADPGRNSFLGNLDGAIANITPNPVLAQWNWFGTTDAAAIASSIVDCRAAPSYGCVDYVPFLSRAPRGNGR